MAYAEFHCDKAIKCYIKGKSVLMSSMKFDVMTPYFCVKCYPEFKVINPVINDLLTKLLTDFLIKILMNWSVV